MPERGAHLTGTAFAKPSIFEIAAHKTLAGTLEPAAKQIAGILASVNIEKYNWLNQWSDEIYLVIITTLQNYYLQNYAASFSETFYGLERIVVLKDSQIKLNLDKNRLNASLVILVLFPYIHRKFENWQNQNRDQNRWKTCIVKVYKILLAIKEISTLYQYLLYLSNRSKYPTISLALLSISLTYSNVKQEIGMIELLKKARQRNFRTHDGLDLLRLVLVRSIEISAFLLQFLQWWNQERYYDLHFTSLPIPPPPQIPEYAKKFKKICPICKKAPWIHTAIITSGFVYCYQCILPEVRKNKKCPVTGYPANQDHLARLYVQ